MVKKVLMFGLIGVTVMLGERVYASDWDKAGKVLTGIEGLRIFSGGKLDLIGNIFGINRYREKSYSCERYCYRSSYRKVWVPHYVWKKKYVPEHREYDPRYGEVVVEGHYIRYKVERGGHWEWVRE